ncbi:MAG: hypothetical protein HRT72_04930 [Flavobacteriales bacterium]|nr:hypothetical protein [Flavobacteriales bacterium]
MKKNTLTKNKVEILHSNSLGSIGRCMCCNDLRVAFGNAMISLSQNDFVDFNSFFNIARFCLEQNKLEDNTKYLVQTNRDELVLSFTKDEMKKSVELLDISILMLSVRKLLPS